MLTELSSSINLWCQQANQTVSQGQSCGGNQYIQTHSLQTDTKRRKCLLKTDRRKEIREGGKEGDDANDGHSNSGKHLQLFPPSETNLLHFLMSHGFKQKHTCTILYPNKQAFKAKDKCIDSVLLKASNLRGYKYILGSDLFRHQVHQLILIYHNVRLSACHMK